jgi:hypothetical protein
VQQAALTELVDWETPFIGLWLYENLPGVNLSLRGKNAVANLYSTGLI